MKTLGAIFKLLPWILLLVALLLWSMGIKLPGSGNDGKTEIINSTVVLDKIENIGKMELVKFQFREIYDYKKISSGKIVGEIFFKNNDFSPDLKAILITSGEAVGCIDLQKVTEEDINIQQDTLYIKLPKPELCYHKLDLENTRVYDFERSGWWSKLFGDDDEVKNSIENAYRNAEKQIEKSAIEGGILDKTRENAQLILKPMLEEISGKVVVLQHDPDLELDKGIEKGK